MPNAGSPEIDRGRVAYRAEPHFFKDYASQYQATGTSRRLQRSSDLALHGD